MEAGGEILANSIKSLQGPMIGKQTFYQQIDRPLDAAYDIASESMACSLVLEDAAEGMDAFLGKRPATWRGR